MSKFLLWFFLILLVLFGLELTPPAQTLLVMPWTVMLAEFCASAVTLFDSAVTSQGNTIISQSNGFAVSIEAGCNGVEACIILIAAILAFPAPWLNKLWGLLAGILAVQIVNVVRVISLFYLGQWNRDIFTFAHLYLWQALIMLDVLVVWLVWMRTLPSQSRIDHEHK